MLIFAIWEPEKKRKSSKFVKLIVHISEPREGRTIISSEMKKTSAIKTPAGGLLQMSYKADFNKKLQTRKEPPTR